MNSVEMQKMMNIVRTKTYGMLSWNGYSISTACTGCNSMLEYDGGFVDACRVCNPKIGWKINPTMFFSGNGTNKKNENKN